MSKKKGIAKLTICLTLTYFSIAAAIVSGIYLFVIHPMLRKWIIKRVIKAEEKRTQKEKKIEEEHFSLWKAYIIEKFGTPDYSINIDNVMSHYEFLFFDKPEVITFKQYEIRYQEINGIESNPQSIIINPGFDQKVCIISDANKRKELESKLLQIKEQYCKG